MSIYTKKAYDSTKGRGSGKLADNLRRTEQQSRQTYEQFGGTGPSIGLSTRDRQDALREYGINDERRREQAAGSLAGITSQVDQRRAGVSDAIADSLDAQSQAELEAASALGRAEQESEFSKEQSMEGLENQMREISFKEYQSQAQRDDKLDELYQKGAAEDLLQDAAIDGKLRLMDIEHYYNLLLQDMNNSFEMWKVTNDLDHKKELDRMIMKAQNMGAIIEGTTQMVNTAYQAYNRNGGDNAY